MRTTQATTSSCPRRSGRPNATHASWLTSRKLSQTWECDFLGVCEVENRRVLEDLIATQALRDRKFKIAHLDSPDSRGIDLALIYRAPFELAKKKGLTLHPIPLERPTRGVLEARLTVGEQELIVLVNHWPSRYGGLERSRPLRKKAAELCRRIVDARIDAAGKHDADIMLMGDFNDDPYDESVHVTLDAVRNKIRVQEHRRNNRYYHLYNPMWKFLGESGAGTLYYNKNWIWSVFDQCIVNRGMLDDHGFKLVEDSMRIHATDEMRDHFRRPKRFRKDRRSKKWIEGYSDHFPIVGKLTVAAPTKE